MSEDIEFVEPPERKFATRKRYDWDAIVEKLKARPGEWALIYEQDRQSVYAIVRRGGIKAIDTSQFEFASENNTFTEDGTRLCDFKMRYIGKEK